MSEGRQREGWGGDVRVPQAGVPEILAPVPMQQATAESLYQGPVPPVRRRKPQWASAPATYVLGGINCLVLVWMVVSGASLTSPTPEQLLHAGADYGPFVLALGEWWRLVSAMFVHVGLLHLATNMWCLWNLGLLGEPLLGPYGMVAVYMITGIAGNLLSMASDVIL